MGVVTMTLDHGEISTYYYDNTMLNEVFVVGEYNFFTTNLASMFPNLLMKKPKKKHVNTIKNTEVLDEIVAERINMYNDIREATPGKNIVERYAGIFLNLQKPDASRFILNDEPIEVKVSDNLLHFGDYRFKASDFGEIAFFTLSMFAMMGDNPLMVLEPLRQAVCTSKSPLFSNINSYEDLRKLAKMRISHYKAGEKQTLHYPSRPYVNKEDKN